MQFNLTDEQQSVITALGEGKNVVVEARLGSGKEQPLFCAIQTPKRTQDELNKICVHKGLKGGATTRWGH